MANRSQRVVEVSVEDVATMDEELAQYMRMNTRRYTQVRRPHATTRVMSVWRVWLECVESEWLACVERVCLECVERDVASMDEELAHDMRMNTRRYTQVVLRPHASRCVCV